MSAAEWIEIPLPPAMSYVNDGMSGKHAYHRGACKVLVSRDGPERFWHISISCKSRYPSWDEIKKARYDLVPNEVTMAMFLPPKEEYINIHENCFHLHEIRE
jgi:hypothetical protein